MVQADDIKTWRKPKAREEKIGRKGAVVGFERCRKREDDVAGRRTWIVMSEEDQKQKYAVTFFLPFLYCSFFATAPIYLFENGRL